MDSVALGSVDLNTVLFAIIIVVVIIYIKVALLIWVRYKKSEDQTNEDV